MIEMYGTPKCNMHKTPIMVGKRERAHGKNRTWEKEREVQIEVYISTGILFTLTYLFIFRFVYKILRVLLLYISRICVFFYTNWPKQPFCLLVGAKVVMFQNNFCFVPYASTYECVIVPSMFDHIYVCEHTCKFPVQKKT